jgi:hypothetical protein
MRNIFGAVAAMVVFASLGLGGLDSARADDDQKLTDMQYQSCLARSANGQGPGDAPDEINTNCRCLANATVPLLTDEAKAALLSGQAPKGSPFKVTSAEYGIAVAGACPGLAKVMMNRACGKDPNSAACAEAKAAQQQ